MDAWDVSEWGVVSMYRNYRTLRQMGMSREILSEWAVTHNTSEAVSCAIHAIADGRRAADDIWGAPTPAELGHVRKAVEEYVAYRDFPGSSDDQYRWDSVRITCSLRSMP